MSKRKIKRNRRSQGAKKKLMRDPEDYGIIIIDNNYNTAGINPDKGVHEKKMSMTLHKEGKKFKDLSKPQSEINTVRKT